MMVNKENRILTAVGPDKIGLVEKISEFIVQHRCNIEDSKMAVFCGEFALIVQISGEGKDLKEISDQYRQLAEQTGLNIAVKTPSSKRAAAASLTYRLTASLMDHPGVVHKLSSILSRLTINIESMETKTYAAPVSGTPLFRWEAIIAVPATININDLKAPIAAVAREAHIELELSLTTN